MTRRIVVIGAGIGGLSAAVELAAMGCDVTVLEESELPGGKMRELDAGGARIDSGPTVFTMRPVFERLFALAGTSLDDEVGLKSAPLLARHAWLDGSRLDLFPNVEQSVAAISDFAGAEEGAAYARFARESAEIFTTLKDNFMEREKPGPVGLSFSMGLAGIPKLWATRPFRTLWGELGRQFSDPRLRQLFARYATYTGSSPFDAPATLMLIAHAEQSGVCYVNGGMQRLAEALERVARQRGARLHLGTGAEEIQLKGGRVAGVVGKNGEHHIADAVVFNGDVQALTRGLLGYGVRRAVAERGNEPRSLSAITWSLVTSVSGFPLDHHTVFFGDDYPAEFRALFGEAAIADRPTVYVCAQDRGGSAIPTEPERLFVLVNAPARPMADDEVERTQEKVALLLARSGLELDLAASNVARFTPNDFASRFPATDGAIYGWPTHGMFGSFRRQGSRSRVPGLYLAGGSVHPGPGVPMTAISGRLAAAAIRADAGI